MRIDSDQTPPACVKGGMGERQAHGFEFQRQVISRYSLAEMPGYTDEWDARAVDAPVSIKAAGLGSDITLSDFFRVSQINEDFYLIVGFWVRRAGERVFVKQQTLRVPGTDWQALFCPALCSEFRALLADISNDHADDARWRASVHELKARWAAATPNLIRLRFKRDHKDQKRLQCAINYGDFTRHFVPAYDANTHFDPAALDSGGASR